MRNIMKSINTEITINASTEIVWKVLMDFENYSNWNPFVTRIEGEPEVSLEQYQQRIIDSEAHLKDCGYEF